MSRNSSGTKYIFSDKSLFCSYYSASSQKGPGGDVELRVTSFYSPAMIRSSLGDLASHMHRFILYGADYVEMPTILQEVDHVLSKGTVLEELRRSTSISRRSITPTRTDLRPMCDPVLNFAFGCSGCSL
jgi:hypothetical protein